MNQLIPYVVERTAHGERSFDIYSRLLRDRIVVVGSEIDDHVAGLVVAQLLYLQSEAKDRDIHLYVNSPGGSVTAGLAIYDTMQYVLCDVATYCLGQAASMGAVLLAAGAKGKRFALPHARVMIHQPWGGANGTAADIAIQAEEILRNRPTIQEILARHAAREAEAGARDTDRDRFLSAADAVAYGLVDEVVGSLKTAYPGTSRGGIR